MGDSQRCEVRRLEGRFDGPTAAEAETRLALFLVEIPTASNAALASFGALLEVAGLVALRLR